MVHVALSGGWGNVGREILDELVRQGKHEITVLSRTARDSPYDPAKVHNVAVDYEDQAALTSALRGVHTVLCFITADPNGAAQCALIDACVAAGVKRYAPSEWGFDSTPGMFPFKDAVREHLRTVNANKPVLECCRFQPGFFMNYLTYPRPSARQLHMTCVLLDLETKDAIQVDGGEQWYSFTSVEDCARVVARAIDAEEPWPEHGGMVGQRILVKDLIALVAKETGHELTVHRVKSEDLEKGEIKSDWVPPMSHPNIPEAQFKQMIVKILPLMLGAGAKGLTDISPSWNKRLPDMKFTQIGEMLADVWGKGA